MTEFAGVEECWFDSIAVQEERETGQEVDPRAESRAGPRTLAEVLDIGARFWQALDVHDQNAGTRLSAGCEDRFAHGVVLTSKFSGMGGAETALAMLAGHRQHHVRMFSATDCAALCRKALLAHSSCSRAEHVFANVLDLVPEPALQECSAVVRAKLAEWEALVQEAQQAETGEKRKRHEVMKQEDLRVEKQRLGEELFDGLCSLLDNVEFVGDAHCVAHSQKCPVNPRADPNLEKAFWMECAGPPCTAWSRFGARGGWLDQTALPCLAWAFWIRFARPDAVVHECSPSFDIDAVRQIWSGRRWGGGGAAPVDPWTVLAQSQAPSRSREVDNIGDLVPMEMHTCDGASGNEAGPYNAVCSFTFSPEYIGTPSRRSRLYTFAALGGVRLPGTESTSDEAAARLFNSIFRCELSCSAGVYCEADPEAIAEKTRALSEKVGKAEKDEETPLCQEDVLPSSWWIRLQEYATLAKQRGLEVEQASVALVNLMQRAAHVSSVDTRVAPTLLRSSELWCMRRGRMLLKNPEHFYIMGYPAPSAKVPPCLSRFYPFHGLELSEREAKLLCGNGMQLSALGSVMLMVFALPPATRVMTGDNDTG